MEWMEFLGTQLSQIDAAYWFKWLLLCLLIVLVAWFHHLEHDELRTSFQREPVRGSQQLLFLFITRSMHMLLLLMLCTLAIILYDIHTIQVKSAAHIVPMAVVAPAVLPPEAAKVAPPPVQDFGLPFGKISVFSEKDADAQAYLDLIKQRYEKLFVTYYYLLQCRAVDGSGFALLESALRSDLLSAGAPLDTGDNILQAAQGTYNEIYAHSACHKDDITLIKEAFNESLAQLRQRQDTGAR